MTRKSKYAAKATEVDGIRFASKREAGRYLELKVLEKAGIISDLELQPQYPLKVGEVQLYGDSGRRLFYRADFRYRLVSSREEIIEDVKGMKTPVYDLKKAIMRAAGVKITEIK